MTTKTANTKKKDNPLATLTTALATTGDLSPLIKGKDWATTTFSAMTKLIEIDSVGARTQATLGEVYYQILALPIEKQKELTTAWAKVQGVAAPTYEQTGVGRPTTGRKELASVLYAKHPEWLTKEEDNNDTVAGRRITQCILVYKYEAGLAAKPPKQIGPAIAENEKKISSRVLRQNFVMLSGLAKTSDEEETLILLYRRAGVTGRELDKWTEEAKDDVIEVATVAPQQQAEERHA